MYIPRTLVGFAVGMQRVPSTATYAAGPAVVLGAGLVVLGQARAVRAKKKARAPGAKPVIAGDPASASGN
jgi:hypothetical protein